MHTHLTRAWVEIDLGALLRNAAAMAASGAALLPMVKADAYGLGAVPIAHALERIAPWGYGVATVDEGRALRAAGIARPVIVFTPVHGAELDELRVAGLTPVIDRVEEITRWSAAGGGAWHLAVDTGMSRCGVRWDAPESVAAAAALAPPDGAYTHFHSAERHEASCTEQERRFEAALARLGSRPRWLHTENSAALARRTRSRWPLARPGIFLYGVDSADGAQVHADPVVSLRARVTALRTLSPGDTVSYDGTWRAPAPARIATAAIGYADGYRRAFSGCGVGLLHGRRIPVRGVVTMDMTMFDVTDVPCVVGDVITLIGRDGDESLSVTEAAATASLAPYELLSGLSARLEHSYRERA